MFDNVSSELFLINACSSGNFENVKWFLAKTWKYIFGVPDIVEEEKKEKNLKTPKLPVIQRSTTRTGQESFRQNGKLAGHGYSMISTFGVGGGGVNFWASEN